MLTDAVRFKKLYKQNSGLSIHNEFKQKQSLKHYFHKSLWLLLFQIKNTKRMYFNNFFNYFNNSPWLCLLQRDALKKQLCYDYSSPSSWCWSQWLQSTMTEVLLVLIPTAHKRLLLNYVEYHLCIMTYSWQCRKKFKRLSLELLNK